MKFDSTKNCLIGYKYEAFNGETAYKIVVCSNYEEKKKMLDLINQTEGLEAFEVCEVYQAKRVLNRA